MYSSFLPSVFSSPHPTPPHHPSPHHSAHHKPPANTRPAHRSDKLRHTARGLEAIGFNEHASMYHHGYRQYSVDSQLKKEKRNSAGEKKGGVEKKRPMSFIKELIGGKEKEKGEKI